MLFTKSTPSLACTRSRPPSTSPLYSGDVRAIAKWEFLCDQEKIIKNFRNGNRSLLHEDIWNAAGTGLHDAFHAGVPGVRSVYKPKMDLNHGVGYPQEFRCDATTRPLLITTVFEGEPLAFLRKPILSCIARQALPPSALSQLNCRVNRF
jgi:hypothetical protein